MTNSYKQVDVVMPMLGGGTRMKGMQDTCKPLYKLPNGEVLFLKALKSLQKYDIGRLVLVVLDDYLEEFRGYVPEITKIVNVSDVVIVSRKPTDTQLESFCLGLEMLQCYEYRLPVISLDCDICGNLPLPDSACEESVATLFGFKHDNPNKSFIKYTGDKVVDIAEKIAISDTAVFGAYMFRDIDLLDKTVKELRCSGCMSDIFKKYLESGYTVNWMQATNVENYGTLEEWNETLSKKDHVYKAVCFDLDGTLFDTKDLNFKAYQLAYFDLGVTIDKTMFAKTDGLSVYDFNKAMGVECDVEKLKELKAQYYADFVKYAKPNNYLINLIHNTKLKKALVTTARKSNIQWLLDTYDLKFDVIITQESVTKHKPDPEGYTMACNCLELDPKDCLAFEDSRPGFVAARQAGLDCVMVKEFQDDCIRDMSGGSDATTKLLFVGGRLFVRKEAFGAKNAERLKNQYLRLKEEEGNNNYVQVLDYDEDKDWVMYDMPYIIAPSLYEYINKIKLLPRLMEILQYDAKDVTEQYEDIREFCLNTYIRPGMDIYEKVTGIKLDPVFTAAEYIPKFVNNYARTTYHGDSTLENVLVQRDGSLLLIDPVPDGNAVKGLAHDFSKIGQSLMGYEAIRDGKDFDYSIERRIFEEYIEENLREEDYKSLKFHTACLFFRRLKHQIEQNPKLVKPYGDIAWKLLSEFAQGKYSWI